jgi:benzylsuccinate CoA-transferase BbsE subunit/naphthyl-2-methylsuccinate CoA transferase subunit
MARILDLAPHSAVYAARLFAEAGHDVVRVEAPRGDALRRLGPFLGHAPDLEHGAYHQFLNAGKRSLTLDPATAAGRQILLDLAPTAAALIGQAPLPVEPAMLMAANPALVVVEVEDEEPEICAYARSGLLAITGHPGERPVVLGGHVVYAATGLYVSVAAATALFVAQQTGRGQVVRVSVAECMESLVEQAMVTYQATGRGTERRGYRGGVTAISGAFPTADGYAMVSVPYTPERWVDFVQWVDDPELTDPALVDEAERDSKKDFILDRLEQWSRQFPKNSLVEELQARHIPASPVATPLDLAADPQLIARGFLTAAADPILGQRHLPAGAIATLRGQEPRPAPRLGEHTAAILTELGYSLADQQALVESGVV